MKLVKSLILGSTAGVLAVAGAQAADLPSRKAAPVEYVRICDAFGTGYFYIPGTDTCLRVGGRVRAEYRWQNAGTQYSPVIPGVAVGGVGAGFLTATGGAIVPGTVGPVFSPNFAVVPKKLVDQSGFRTLGRIEVDARTQTAWGTLRTFVRYEITYNTGTYASGNVFQNPGNIDHNFNPYIDKAFIQFAGITAGRAQSMFDFYADNYGYQDIRGSDESINLLAYTATFAGGFTATISAEDSSTRRAGVLGPGVGVVGAPALFVPGGIAGTFGGAAYNGQTWPDIVGVLRVDQGWGAAQLSAAIHNQSSSILFTVPGGVPGVFGPTGTFPISGGGNSVGWAVQGGVQIKLPMLAAGDDFWLQAAYAHGALDYQQVGANEFGRINNNNGFHAFYGDAESVLFIDPAGIVHNSEPNSWTVLAAFNHYFTPTFATSLRGSYLNVSYGNGARFPFSALLGGVAGTTTPGVPGLATNWSEWRVALNPEWYPVKGLTLGFEIMYVHLNQKAPLISGFGGAVLPFGGGLAGVAGANTVLPWKSNTNGWEARLRVQRDF